jgi:ATP-dependent Clp protease ATP-binding subunit ClpA
MLRSTVSPLETHHRVLLLDEAVVAAVKLSHRYIPARQLPIKPWRCSTPPARVSRSARARRRRNWKIACTALPGWMWR